MKIISSTADELTFLSSFTWIIYYNELWWIGEWWIVCMSRYVFLSALALNLTHRMKTSNMFALHKYRVFALPANEFDLWWIDLWYYFRELNSISPSVRHLMDQHHVFTCFSPTIAALSTWFCLSFNQLVVFHSEICCLPFFFTLIN